MDAKRRKHQAEDASKDTSEVAASNNGNKKQRSVEEIYQKKSQLEHILLRPDSYVGSTEKQTQDHFVWDPNSHRMVQKRLEYVPALYKIFDEILVNAADNLVRCPEQDTIRVDVDTAAGSISVWNNGKGLPVQMHNEHKVYVPELVFGQLLTSDNYDDSEKKVVGGRNGYGAKLTNIFSTKFIVETGDSMSGKWYKQVWEKNMTKRNDPQMKKHSGEDFTKVTFFPELSRFGMSHMEEDIVLLMRRRAFDVAASTHGRCKVFLDGKRLEVESFSDYVGLHLAQDTFRICSVVNDRWEVAVGLTDGSGFQQVSFVNSICTSRGGTHVNYIADQVAGAVLEKVEKEKKKGLAVKAQHVKGYLWVFVNCLVENPAFDSQTKETLTSKRDRFGSKCDLPDDFLNGILESGIIDALQEWSKAMNSSELAQHLNKSDLGLQKRLFGVPKLEDANKAGTKESSECTLILTEGDSAKALAVAGLGIVGRDRFGVFPLRGKLRNVRDLTVKQMLENKEIDAIMKIMALDASKTYEDTKGLRYGSIMIMTDQDPDGSHIKGLIINFIQRWFPSLLQVPGFLTEFVTPLVKVSKGEETHTFFTIPEYSAWKDEHDGGKGWKCKYYKGLGTSTSQEAREYFSNIQDHNIQFTYGDEQDDDLIDMAFNPKRADDRKQWIGDCEEGTFVDHSAPTLSYNDFVKKELVLFAKYDVERMVPSLVDGLKPGQRKVLFGAFKKKLSSDMKVAQLSGYVAENAAYHHGEGSLQGTIIGLAQNFVGSNNLNLLVPSGQFGTRLQGGKDHAAARYIYTRLTRAARCIFPDDDDAVLDYLNEEGISIEPRTYFPVVPLVLVNGAEGIGTGWSTTVPNYNPRDIVENVRRALRKEPMEPMVPFYRGFKGTISPVVNTPGKFESIGVVLKRGRVRLEITELPVRRWTQDYKEWLMEQLPKQGCEQRAVVTEMREHHSHNSVHFVLSMTPDKLAEAERKGMEKVFHLRSSITTSNMWLFDPDGNIKKYETPEEIIAEFIPVRLNMYGKRKAHLVEKLERELAVVANKLKFVRLVIEDKLEVEKRKAASLHSDMRKHGLQTMREINGKGGKVPKPAGVDDGGPDGYKYLLSMKLWSLTEDRLAVLTDQRNKKEAELEELKATTLETMWERDLVKLEAAMDQDDADLAKEEAEAKQLEKDKSDDVGLQNKQCVLILNRNFTAKRLRTSQWKAKKRGAKLNERAGVVIKKRGGDGEKGEGEDDEGEDDDEDTQTPGDALAGVFCCRDFDALLIFSEEGMVYGMQALDVPLAKKTNSPGVSMSTFLPELGEKQGVAAIVTVDHRALKEQVDQFIILVTTNGMSKKIPLDRFRGLRPGKGVKCIKLASDDSLRWAHRVSANSALVLTTEQGFLTRCSVGPDCRCNSLAGTGQNAMKMRTGSQDAIASCSISQLTVQEVDRIQRKLAEKQAKQEQKGQEGQDDAMDEDEEETKGEVDQSKLADGASRKPQSKRCDDDDSDNEAAKEAPANGKAVSGNAGDESDGEADEEAADGEGGEGGDGAAGEEEADPAPSEGLGQCALIVTEQGMGLRMPLCCKKIGLARGVQEAGR